MTNDVYEQLADALDRLPNGFPRTPSNAEIRILKKIFSPAEASLASQLSGDMETFDALAGRIGLPAEEAKAEEAPAAEEVNDDAAEKAVEKTA